MRFHRLKCELPKLLTGLFEEGGFCLTVSPFCSLESVMTITVISRVSLSATCAVSLWFVDIASVVKQHPQESCGEESRVVSIEGVPPLPCGIVCAVRPLQGKRN